MGLISSACLIFLGVMAKYAVNNDGWSGVKKYSNYFIIRGGNSFDYQLNKIILKYLKMDFKSKFHPPTFIQEKSVMPHELIGETFTAYKGIPLLPFRGISLWGFILFLLLLVIKDGIVTKAVLPVSIMCVFWYAVNSYFSFYIKVSENYLVIKNYFVPFGGKNITCQIFKKWRLKRTLNGLTAYESLQTHFNTGYFHVGRSEIKSGKHS